ncbi:MAG: CoA transferase [Pseudomonadota bacterium]
MKGPLHGIVVVDLTHVLAGPYASMSLGDLGARVIKVERPGTGDDTRAFPPFRNETSAYFATINRGKESIALDLKSTDDRAIFERLLARADVLLENFRPGVMDRLGYGWESLHERYPRLIYGAVSGFGRTGPDSLRPAYDMVVQARGGVMSITGEVGGEPVRVGASIGDIVAGIFLGEGIMAALYSRERTGNGALVDVAMLDSQFAILEHAIAITNETGVPPAPMGARHPSITPFESFHASDGMFIIAAGNDALYAKLCHAIGRPKLISDPRFHTNQLRCENHELLKREIERITLGETVGYWVERLVAAGVPSSPIHTVRQAMSDPQLRARKMHVEVASESGKPFAGAGNPIKMSINPDGANAPKAPRLDEHRAQILEWLDAG